MKKITFAIILFLITARLFAQDCTEYMFMKKNSTIEQTTFSLGKPQNKIVFFVADVTTSNGTTTSNVVATGVDKNGKSTGKNNVSFKCTGGAFIVDLSASGSQPNIKFMSGSMSYPASMKVGQHFDDFDAQLEMNFGGKTTKANAKYADRKVVDQEVITTPAGTWTCFKITYNMEVTITGFNMPPSTTQVTEWFVPHFGVVQTQIGAQMGSFTLKITSIK